MRFLLFLRFVNTTWGHMRLFDKLNTNLFLVFRYHLRLLRNEFFKSLDAALLLANKRINAGFVIFAIYKYNLKS